MQKSRRRRTALIDSAMPKRKQVRDANDDPGKIRGSRGSSLDARALGLLSIQKRGQQQAPVVPRGRRHWRPAQAPAVERANTRRRGGRSAKRAASKRLAAQWGGDGQVHSTAASWAASP